MSTGLDTARNLKGFLPDEISAVKVLVAVVFSLTLKRLISIVLIVCMSLYIHLVYIKIYL